MKRHPLFASILVAALTVSSLVVAQPREDRAGATYRIPYRLAPTNHIIVRAKINGHGPFNFIVDTGAPAIFIDPATAKRAGIDAPKEDWSDIAKLEIEGGIVIEKTRARVQELYQTTGINAMLPEKGMEITGVIGYNILARYKLDIDFTRSHMLWTKLDFEPLRPLGVAEVGGEDAKAEQEKGGGGIDAMTGMAKVMQMLMGNRPKVEPPKPGYLGLELEEVAAGLRVAAVHRNSPAEIAGLKAGDVLLELGSQPVRTLQDAAKISPNVPEGAEVPVKFDRKGTTLVLTIRAGNGL